MIIGVVLGLGAATSQSVAYLFSRMYANRFERNPVYLLTVSHIILAIFALFLLPIFWPDTIPEFQVYAWPLIGSSLFYLFGQGALFMALAKSAASRASPLLGLKVFILALISVLFRDVYLTTFQWLAVFLSVAAAMMLNRSGGSLPWQSIGWILSACLGYSLSDIHIKQLVGHFEYLGLFHASTLSVCLSYLLCGAVGIACLYFLPDVSKKMWIHAIPYSISWFVAMMLLFACFASIGVVFGNIVQSSRGIISIILGSFVAAVGYEHIEDRLKHAVFIRRIGAACLMVSAIALFYLG